MLKIKFEDIKFKYIPEKKGIQSIIKCPNGYDVSVVQNEFSYGRSSNLYEIAILKNGRICYYTKITNDVIGWLSEKEVEETILAISKLKRPSSGVIKFKHFIKRKVK